MTATLLFVWAAVAMPAPAQTFTVLYSFTGSSDGGYPYGGLVQDSLGNLYGATYNGGSAGYGVVFAVDSTGAETVLYNFQGGTTDGCHSYAGVVMDAGGNLYGTTSECGASNHGIVFKVDTTGTETVLHNFAGGTTDGCLPYGGLTLDGAGNLYGTTSACGTSDYGVIFKLDSDGNETILYNFAGRNADGCHPFYSSPVADAQGSLYGVADGCGSSGHGVVYKLDSTGVETVLHSFAGGSDGCDPFGAVALDSSGNVFGTTMNCGSAEGFGTVWEATQDKKETVLHSFAGGTSDGSYAQAGLIMDASGNLYGNTLEGGDANLGTVFEATQSGAVTLLHSFSYTDDGANPTGTLLQDASGNLYGTSLEGGSGGYGTVWVLSPQRKRLRTSPAAAKDASSVHSPARRQKLPQRKTG